MVHRNRWFTELNSMVIFHGKLLNSQRVNAIYPDYMVMGQNSGALGCPGYLEIAGILWMLIPPEKYGNTGSKPMPIDPHIFYHLYVSCQSCITYTKLRSAKFRFCYPLGRASQFLGG